jgi:hypothetical protein
MNPVAKDQAMWLVDVRVQLVYNLQEAQKRYKENVDEHQKEQPSFKLGTKFGFNKNISKQQGHQRSWIIKG